MKTRPKEFTGLALLMFGIALSFPLQIILTFHDDPFDLVGIATKLAPLNWMIILLSCAMIPLTLRASSFLWAAVPVFLGCVSWNNWLVATLHDSSISNSHGNLNWTSPEHLSTLALLFVFAGILSRHSCRTALLHPGRRWWLTPKRNRVYLDAKICPVLGGEMVSKTFDLSESGAFIALSGAKWQQNRLRVLKETDQASPSSLRVGSYCWLRVVLNHVSSFTCTAEIVRHSDARGVYPAGIGLRFVNLTPQERKTLHGFLKKLNYHDELAISPQAVKVAPNKQAA